MVCTLSHWMTLSEVAAVSHLHWASVKEIVKSDLFKRYKKIPLRQVRYLARPFSCHRLSRAPPPRRSMNFTSGAKVSS